MATIMFAVVALCCSVSIICALNVNVATTVIPDTGMASATKSTDIVNIEDEQSSSAKTKSTSTEQPKKLLETAASATGTATALEAKKEELKSMTDTAEQKKYNDWFYEPKNINYFWSKMGDRPFQREFYSHVGKSNSKYNKVIDVGARGYNRNVKELINSETIEYFQIEPYPPAINEMDNDGLLQCKMQQVIEQFPHLRNTFDLVVDFGVFGFKPVLDDFNDADIRKYVEAVQFLLKDNKSACWALKVDKGWVDDTTIFFNEYVLPHFNMGTFENAYKSGHSIKRGNFIFYFFFKK